VAGVDSTRTASLFDGSMNGGRSALGRSVSAAALMTDGLLERREPSVARRLTARERRVEAAMAGLFLAVAVPLAIVGAGEWHNVPSAVLLVGTYAFVARVRFQVGPGLVRPTQLVLVPMLFLLPAPSVPLLVAAGSLLSELPAIARRRAHPERVLVSLADSWHAVGPAVVLGLLVGANSSRITWDICLLALLTQFAVDFAASTLREWFGAGIRPRELAPVLAIVYLVDTLLTPIGLLAVLASREYTQAYLLAVAPGALLALLAHERRGRIEQDLALGRAYRRSTRLLDAQAEDLRWQAGRLKGSPREAHVATTLDRGALERFLLTTTVEAVEADCGRLNTLAEDGTSIERFVLGRMGEDADALRAAEAALLSGPVPRQVTVGDLTVLAIPLGARSSGRGESLTVGRAGSAFSLAECELLEHLAAHAAVSLENVHLQELMRKTEEELRAILEGVADGITAEDPAGKVVYMNAAAAQLLGHGDPEVVGVSVSELVSRLRVTDERGEPVPAERLPGCRALAGEDPAPLVLRYRRADTGEARCSRVKATPVFDRHGGVRLAISVIEDITEIKQVEEGQRFLAECSSLLADSLDVNETLPAVARLAVPRIADWCAIHLAVRHGVRCIAVAHGDPAKLALADALARDYPPGTNDAHGVSRVVQTGCSALYSELPDELLAAAAHDERHLHLLRSLGTVSAMCVPIRARDQVVGAITFASAESGRRFGQQDLAIAEDLGMRAGTTVDTARLYRTRSAIAQTLQASLLPPVLPEIAGLETAALFRAAGEGHEVGGDFYDLFSTGKNQWFAVMGDVCGKGAEAAAVTALARYTIRSAVVRHRSPSGVLHWLNDAMLRQRLDPGRFATVACARLDLERDGVCATVSSGGHPCPRILRSTGLVEELGAPGTLLGAVPDVRLTDRSTRLTSGDALIFFTDGLTEAGAPTHVWSPAQLDAAVAGARHQPARGIVDHLTRSALGDATATLRDDIAVLALRVR
jgi:PAS domain S-box-containing protein